MYCLEKKIEEYWNVDGENYLMILQKEKPHQGYTWSWVILTRKQKTSRPDNVWPDMWKHMSGAPKQKSTKIGHRETEARQCQTIEKNILQ